MKVRHGFVSNSSSSSFVVSKAVLSDIQLLIIRNHIEAAKFFKSLSQELGPLDWDEKWSITENDEQVFGDTSMDNFDMRWLLDQIGIPAHAVSWGED